jgi:hypothetical protein
MSRIGKNDPNDGSCCCADECRHGFLRWIGENKDAMRG